MTAARFKNSVTEAANRAEATALLIRCGYRVYRPEADIEGEDLMVRRDRDRAFLAVQLKARLYVDESRYGQLGLWLLFPSSLYREDIPRHWYLVPHDDLYERVKTAHGASAKWANAWSSAKPSASIQPFLAEHRLTPISGTVAS